MSFKSIMDYWKNKNPDNTFCSNCSYSYVNDLCPCKLNHILNEMNNNKTELKNYLYSVNANEVIIIK